MPWGRGSALTPCPPAPGSPGQFSAGLCPPVPTPACGAGPPGDLRAPFRFVDGEPRQWSGRKMPAPPPLGPGKGLPCLPQPPRPDHPLEAPGRRPALASDVGSELPSHGLLSVGESHGNDAEPRAHRRPGGCRDESPPGEQGETTGRAGHRRSWLSAWDQGQQSSWRVSEGVFRMRIQDAHQLFRLILYFCPSLSCWTAVGPPARASPLV